MFKMFKLQMSTQTDNQNSRKNIATEKKYILKKKKKKFKC